MLLPRWLTYLALAVVAGLLAGGAAAAAFDWYERTHPPVVPSHHLVPSSRVVPDSTLTPGTDLVCQQYRDSTTPVAVSMAGQEARVYDDVFDAWVSFPHTITNVGADPRCPHLEHSRVTFGSDRQGNPGLGRSELAQCLVPDSGGYSCGQPLENQPAPHGRPPWSCTQTGGYHYARFQDIDYCLNVYSVEADSFMVRAALVAPDSPLAGPQQPVGDCHDWWPWCPDPAPPALDVMLAEPDTDAQCWQAAKPDTAPPALGDDCRPPFQR